MGIEPKAADGVYSDFQWTELCLFLIVVGRPAGSEPGSLVRWHLLWEAGVVHGLREGPTETQEKLVFQYPFNIKTMTDTLKAKTIGLVLVVFLTLFFFG